MTRKGLIVVEQMPLLLITPTSQELLFKAILVLSGPLTVPALLATAVKKQRDIGVSVPRSSRIKSW